MSSHDNKQIISLFKDHKDAGMINSWLKVLIKTKCQELAYNYMKHQIMKSRIRVARRKEQ